MTNKSYTVHFGQKKKEADIAKQVEEWKRMTLFAEKCVWRRKKKMLTSTFS